MLLSYFIAPKGVGSQHFFFCLFFCTLPFSFLTPIFPTICFYSFCILYYKQIKKSNDKKGKQNTVRIEAWLSLQAKSREDSRNANYDSNFLVSFPLYRSLIFALHLDFHGQGLYYVHFSRNLLVNEIRAFVIKEEQFRSCQSANSN